MNILVAEDDGDICRLYKSTLESRKYRVVLTHDGQECLDIYYHKLRLTESSSHFSNKNVRVPFDALLLDYKIPKKNGLEVAKEILAIKPHQRIIFASAYVKDTLESAAKALENPIEFLQKPFTMAKLVDVLEDVEIYAELNRLGVNIDEIKKINPTHEQLTELLEGIRKLGFGTANGSV